MSIRLIIATILLGFSMLGAIFLVWPEYKNYISLRATGQELQKSIVTKQDYFKGLNTTNEQLQRYQRQLSFIDYAVPNNPQVPFTYHMFSNMGFGVGGVRLDDVAIAGEEAGKSPALGGQANQVRPTGVTLQIRGSYDGIKEYLEYLNKIARIIHIESVSLKPDTAPDDKGPTGIYSASINLKVFSY